MNTNSVQSTVGATVSPDLSSVIEIRKRLFAPRVSPEADELQASFESLRSAEAQRNALHEIHNKRSTMKKIAEMVVRLREWRAGTSKGQTMTEYALILGAVAIVVFVTYQTMGQDIGSLVNVVNSDLTTAS